MQSGQWGAEVGFELFKAPSPRLAGMKERRSPHSDRLPKEHLSHLSLCPQVHCLMIYPETTPVCQSTSVPAR